MRIPWRILLFTLFGCLAAAGCGTRQPSMMDQILAAGTMTVLVPENAGTYAYLESDGVTWNGSEIQLAQAVADRIGVDMSVRALTKAQLLEGITQGEGHMAVGRIAYNNSLPYNYAVSQPYGTGRIYAVTPRGVLFPTAIALENRTVGVTDQLSENALLAVHQIQGVTVNTYPDINLVEDTLIKGLICAYLCYEDQAFALANVASLQAQNIAVGEKESYVVVGPRGAGSLMEQVNQVIAERQPAKPAAEAEGGGEGSE
jgi:ABC-type amino acid transport substrate-binding protein